MSVLPFVRRRVLEPIWAQLTGSPMLSAWKDLEGSQALTLDVLRERQWERLVGLLHAAYDSNDLYRQRLDAAGVSPGSLRGPEDFARIPVLTKQEVRAHGDRLLSRGFDASKLIQAKTGGSTGVPLEVRFTDDVSQLRNASGRRHKRWSGWEVGEPMAAIWGNPVFPVTLKARLREWMLSPVTYLDTMSVTDVAVRQFVRNWKRIKPTLIFGHAHSVFVLAGLLHDMGIDDIRPRGVITSSMMLLPHERKTIEAVFGVKVTDMYGCEEVGLIASECERHEGLHMNVDQLVVEVLRSDGSPAPPGEVGVVVVTDLLNRAMPMIRYRMEDTAELAGTPCTCGRGLPLLRRITGRVADFLRRQDGSRVAGISLIENSLTRIPGLEQMQIVQEALDRICLRIVPAAGFTADRRQELMTYFGDTFPGARINLEDVNEILPEPNGKYRFSICRIVG